MLKDSPGYRAYKDQQHDSERTRQARMTGEAITESLEKTLKTLVDQSQPASQLSTPPPGPSGGVVTPTTGDKPQWPPAPPMPSADLHAAVLNLDRKHDELSKALLRKKRRSSSTSSSASRNSKQDRKGDKDKDKDKDKDTGKPKKKEKKQGKDRYRTPSPPSPRTSTADEVEKQEALQKRLLEAYFAFKVQFKGPRNSWAKQLADKQASDRKVQEAIKAVFPRFGKAKKMPRPLAERAEEAISLLLDPQ